MTTVEVPANTIVVYGDIGCPWAHIAVHRLHATRERLGLTDQVVIEPRAFPLELINEIPTPKLILDAEIPVAGGLEPAAGWQVWQLPTYEYPVTVLLALEAVEAAKAQGPRAAEKLDRALRVALFGQSRVISMQHVILEIAGECGLDTEKLHDDLVHGRARPEIQHQLAVSLSDAVEGSPHVYTPDGYNVHNPGIKLRWEGRWGVGFPVIESDDPSVYEDLLLRAKP
ncbi:DsbA family oxidoreductase [Saccharopolyspora taberi]|uniref:Dithiol-disulfide isomerase n=1 Tax=Saccharopolyspora taberi TaxID=60895 RepID=A0ABN3V4X3_9PSEU